MPNHVTTRCTVTGPAADVAAFRARMLIPSIDENGPFTVFDFNKIIPQPENLSDIEDYSERGVCLFTLRVVAAAYLAKHPEYETPGRRWLRAILDTGVSGWYTWRCVNWGTKSNSYSLRLLNDNPLVFSFATAWSFPELVFVALARAFPTVHFRCQTVEECGNFQGDGYFNPPLGEPAWSCW